MLTEKTAVFIDAGHYHYRLYGKWQIDYKKLLKFFEDSGYLIIDAFYYEGIPSKNSYFHSNPGASLEDFSQKKKKKLKLFRKLRSFGLIVKHKPVCRIFDKGLQQYKLKCNSDVEMTIDIMESLFSKPADVYILCTGDGDFLRVAKYIKGQNKKVIVVGIKKQTNKNLKDTAHEVIFLDDIRETIEHIK